MKNQHHHSGFTLVELLVTISIISLLLVGYYAPQVQSEFEESQRTIARTVAEEIYQIGAAAQAHAIDTGGDWPDNFDNCRGAIDELTLNNYLAGIDEESAFNSADISFGLFYTACPETITGTGIRNHFVIFYLVPREKIKYAGIIQNALPATSQLADTGGDVILQTDIPLPAAIPALQALLPLDGARAMTGELDMGGNDIAGVSDVFLQTGQTLGSAPVFSGIVRPGTAINKPTCPPGYAGSIVVVPVDVAHSSGQPISKMRVFARESASFWTAHSEVVSITGTDSDHNKVSMAVSVRCQI